LLWINGRSASSHCCREDLKHVSSKKISKTAQVNVVNIAPLQPAGGAAPLCAASIVFCGCEDGETILVTTTGFAIAFGQICSVPLPF
jgi:hypothetical protein